MKPKTEAQEHDPKASSSSNAIELKETVEPKETSELKETAEPKETSELKETETPELKEHNAKAFS